MDDMPRQQSAVGKKAGWVGCYLGIILGVVLGATGAVGWIYLNPPAISPGYLNSDGLNRYGGEMALIVMGVLLGGVIGGCIGANKINNNRR